MTSAAQTSRALRRAFFVCATIVATTAFLATSSLASAASTATSISLTAQASGVSPASAITVPANTSVTLTATVGATTGVVKFTVGSHSPVAVNVDASTSTATYPVTVAATTTVTARYYTSATSPIPAGTSNTVTITIGTAPVLNTTSLSMGADPTQIASGQASTLTATLTGGVGTDGELISFYDSGTLLGTGTLSGGVATYPVAGFGNGTTHSFTAKYAGDAQNMPATSAPVTVTVNIPPSQVQTTVTLSASPASIPVGGFSVLTAHVQQTGGTLTPPAGEFVSFWVSGNSVGTAPLDANGNATFSVGGATAGNIQVTAKYLGDTTFAGNSGSATVAVTPVAPPTLTITAPSATVSYGTAASIGSPTYSGFTGSDTPASLQLAPTCSTTETASSPPGTYPVTCTGARSENYTIAYVAGTVTVTPATLTVTGPSASIAYGSAPGSFTPSYSGFVNGDSPASLSAQATCGTTASASSPAGSYAITCSGAAGGNYSFNYVAGTLTVSQATLTVTAPSATIAYGSSPGTLTPSYSGFVNGDTVSAIATAPTCTTTASATSPPGSYPVSCSGGSSQNYAFNYVAGTITVTQVTLTVTAPSASAVYGAGPGTLTPSYSGFAPGDGPSSLATAPTCTTTATAASSVGTYGVTCSGGSDGKYDFTYVPGTLTVTKAPVVVTAPSASVVYGAGPGTLAPSYSGFVNGDTVSSLTSPATCTTVATASSPVGSYAVTCNGATAANYSFSNVAGTISVTKAMLTVTGPNASSVYGSVPGTFAPSYSGFVGGDSVSSLTTPATCTSSAGATSSVGSYAIACSGAAAANYDVTYVAGTLSVTKAMLTVTGPSASSVYGSAPGSFTPSYSGFVNGDTVSSLTSPATCTTPATAASPVGAYGITCSGGAAANYDFAYVAGTLSVTKAPLSVTGPTASSVYGTVPGTFTPTYSGFVNGDGPASLTSAPTCSTTATAASPVGSYAITCSGGSAANYDLVYVAGTLNVGKATLTVTGPSASSVYGSAPGTFTPTYSGFVNGDGPASLTSAPTCSTTATAASPVGSYAIACSGGSAANYTFTYVAGTLSVTKATLTVTGPSATSVYGSAPGTFGPSYSGFVNGDTVSSLTSPATCTTTATAASPVGSYAIACSGAAATNYDFTYVAGTLSVTKATLTVTGPSATSVYGSAPGAFTPTYSGFVNGDTVSSLTSPATCTTAATAASPVGSYAINCGGATAANYDVTYAPGTLTVGKAMLTVTGPSASSVYGSAPGTFTPTYAGFVNGDTSSSLSSPATCTTTATAASPVGSYAIACSGGAAANYTFTYVNGSLNVTKAMLTVTGPSASSVYGSAPGTFTPTYSGFVNGDGVSSLTSPAACTTAATAASTPGSYAIACSGAAAANYDFTYVNGGLTVGKATLTVTPNDATMVAGAALPNLTATLSGFVNGQTLSTSDVTGAANCTTTATSSSPAGTYPITCTTGTLASADYAFVASGSGTLTVQPAIGSRQSRLINWTIPVAVVGQRVVLSATLVTDGFPLPLANRTLTLTLGDQSCTAVTNFLGTAFCSVLVTGPAGQTTATATFAGDATFAPVSETKTALILATAPRRRR